MFWLDSKTYGVRPKFLSGTLFFSSLFSFSACFYEPGFNALTTEIMMEVDDFLFQNVPKRGLSRLKDSANAYFRPYKMTNSILPAIFAILIWV